MSDQVAHRIADVGSLRGAFEVLRSHPAVDIRWLDYQLLGTIRGLIAPLEVAARTAADWERAILAGCRAWHQLRDHDGGVITLNANDQTLTFEMSMLQS